MTNGLLGTPLMRSLGWACQTTAALGASLVAVNIRIREVS